MNGFSVEHHDAIDHIVRAESEGKAKVLYILDGWDELRKEHETSKRIIGHLMQKPYLIITTRPEGVPNLQDSMPDVAYSRRGTCEPVRLLGLSPEIQDRYIQECFATLFASSHEEIGSEGTFESRKVTDFKDLIKRTPLLSDQLSNPIILEMLCYAFFISEGRAINLTTLHRHMVEEISKRYLGKIAPSEVKRREREGTSFCDHPIINLALKCFGQICLNTLSEKRTIIEREDLLPIVRSLETLESRFLEEKSVSLYELLIQDFGLLASMQLDSKGHPIAWRIKHFPLHEYLAAHAALDKLHAESDKREQQNLITLY